MGSSSRVLVFFRERKILRIGALALRLLVYTAGEGQQAFGLLFRAGDGVQHGLARAAAVAQDMHQVDVAARAAREAAVAQAAHEHDARQRGGQGPQVRQVMLKEGEGLCLSDQSYSSLSDFSYIFPPLPG